MLSLPGLPAALDRESQPGGGLAALALAAAPLITGEGPILVPGVQYCSRDKYCSDEVTKFVGRGCLNIKLYKNHN